MILDANGNPVVPKGEESCPKCGAGPDRRVPSGGFGASIHPVCIGLPGRPCSYEFEDQSCPSVIL
jgi:hypothetical protein